MNMYTPEEQRLYEALFRNPRVTEGTLAESLTDDRPPSRRLLDKVTVLLSNRGLPRSRDRVALITELELTLLKLVREQPVTTLSGLVDAYAQVWAATETAERMPAPLLASFLSVRLGLDTDHDLRLYRMAALAEPWTDGDAPAEYWSFAVRMALLGELRRTRAVRDIQDEMVRRLSAAAKLHRDTAQSLVARQFRELMLDSQTGIVASVVRPLDSYPDFTPLLGTAVYPDRPERTGEKRSGRRDGEPLPLPVPELGSPTRPADGLPPAGTALPKNGVRPTGLAALEQRLASLEQLVAGQPDYADVLPRLVRLEQQLQSERNGRRQPPSLPESAAVEASDMTPAPPQQDVTDVRFAALNEELQQVRTERDQATTQVQQLETVGRMLERQLADVQVRLQTERRQAIVEFLSDLAGERSHHILGQLHRALEYAGAPSNEALVSLIRTLLNGLYRQGLTPYLPDDVVIGQKVSGRPEQMVRTYQPDASVVMVGHTGELEAVVAAFGWMFGEDIISRPLITNPDSDAGQADAKELRQEGAQ